MAGLCLAAGSAQMAQTPGISGQGYVSVRQQVSKGKYINIVSGNETVFSVLTPKQVNHVIYTSPELASGATVSSADQPGTTAVTAPEDKTGSSTDKEPETGESETDAKEPETGESETDKKDPETGESETKAPESQSSTKETNGVQETQQSSQKAEQVKPKKTKITAIQKKNGKITIKWKKVSGASGYEVWYSAKKKSGYKKLTVKKVQKVTVKTGKKLKKGKTWYLKVRSYKVTGGTKVYSKWSEVKKVKS